MIRIKNQIERNWCLPVSLFLLVEYVSQKCL
nr:MAG TPA: cysteine protease [Caudoviricetes sp.]